MKRVIALIILLSVSNTLFAGGWQCHRHRVEIYLQNDTLIGYIELGDHDYIQQTGGITFSSKTTTAEFKAKSNFKFYKDMLTLHDTIYSLKYPVNKYPGEQSHTRISAILPYGSIKIPVKLIKGIKLSDAQPCNEWKDKDYKHNNYGWSGDSQPIRTLTFNEIKLLQEPPQLSLAYTGLGDFELTTIYVLTYNSTLTQEDVDKEFQMLNAKSYDAYDNFKKKLNNKGAVVFTIISIP